MKFRRSLVIILIPFFIANSVSAQCAMCRAAIESSGDTGVAEGVNNGIVYLMAVPYILVAVLFYFIYKKMKSPASV